MNKCSFQIAGDRKGFTEKYFFNFFIYLLFFFFTFFFERERAKINNKNQAVYYPIPCYITGLFEYYLNRKLILQRLHTLTKKYPEVGMHEVHEDHHIKPTQNIDKNRNPLSHYQ